VEGALRVGLAVTAQAGWAFSSAPTVRSTSPQVQPEPMVTECERVSPSYSEVKV